MTASHADTITRALFSLRGSPGIERIRAARAANKEIAALHPALVPACQEVENILCAAFAAERKAERTPIECDG